MREGEVCRVGGETIEANTEVASANLFRVLGSAPKEGSTWGSDDLGTREVVLSFPFWQRHFGGKESAIGSDLVVNGTRFEISGVEAPGFDFPPNAIPPTDIWLSASADPTARDAAHERDLRAWSVIARLAPGESVGHFRAALGTVARRLALRFPVADGSRTNATVEPAQRAIAAGITTPAELALIAAGLVFLACALNAVGLALARNGRRREEIVVCRLLGAGRLRLARRFALREVPHGLEVLGGAVGLGYLIVRALRALGGRLRPRSVALASTGGRWRLALLCSAQLGLSRRSPQQATPWQWISANFCARQLRAASDRRGRDSLLRRQWQFP